MDNDMFTTDAAIAAYMGAQHQVASRTQLISWGLTDRQIEYRLTTKLFLPIQPSVIKVAGSPDTLEQQAAACCLCVPDAVLAGPSAGRLWGFRRMPKRPTLMMTSAVWVPTLQGAAVWRTAPIAPEHVVVRDDAIRLTTPARTLVELARYVGDDVMASVMDQVMEKFDVTLPTLHRLKREVTGRGRTGSARFQRVLAGVSASQRAPMSEHERVLFRAIVQAGIDEPERQGKIRLPDDRDIHVDFWWPNSSLVVEFDHSTWHAGRKIDVRRDKWRDRQLAALGIETLRFDEDDLALCLIDVISDIRLHVGRRRGDQLPRQLSA
jgi:very-short-patch-repair endonuclease